MTFLAPLFLAAAAAIAVPIILHLFRRKDHRVHAFPALRYLQRTTRERARIIRLRQLLLLAVRITILALLVLAGARWVIPVGGGDQPPAGIVLVVDNGLTSGQVVDDRRILDHLLDRAHAALDRTGEEDRIWVLAAGEPWSPAWPLNRHEARIRLGEIEPVATRADLGRSVARARALLEAGAPALREILVLSDLNAESLPAPYTSDGEPPGGGIRIVLGTVDAPAPPNRGVTTVEVGGGLPPRAGVGSEVGIALGGEGTADQVVRLFVGDDLVTAGRTDAAGRALLALPPQAAGWVTGRAEIDSDALRVDDLRWFALPVRSPPPVTGAESLPRFLQTALEVLDERNRIRRVEPGAGGGAIGVEAGGIALPGLRPTLIFAPADPALLPAVNRRLADFEAGWRLSPLRSEDPGAQTLASEVPVLRLPSDLTVRRAYPLEALEGGRPGFVLARLADGSPWIVHIPGDPGEDVPPGLLLVASAPDGNASELPVSATMIPFTAAALELLDGGSPPLALAAGEPLPLPAEAHAVTLPGGSRIPVDGTTPFRETGLPGIYEVISAGGALLARVAVNPRSEHAGELTRLDPGTAAVRLGPDAEAATTAGGWRRAVLAERRGREVWRPLAAASLLLLLLESLLAAPALNGRREEPISTPPETP